MADVFGIEKVWASTYENNRQHGYFDSKKRKFPIGLICVEYSIAVERWSGGCESGGVNTTQKSLGIASLLGRCVACISLLSWKACRCVIIIQLVDSHEMVGSVAYIVLMRGDVSDNFEISTKITNRFFKKMFTFFCDFCFVFEKYWSPHSWVVFQFFYKKCEKIFLVRLSFLTFSKSYRKPSQPWGKRH